jgi:hypothetical protein
MSLLGQVRDGVGLIGEVPLQTLRPRDREDTAMSGFDPKVECVFAGRDHKTQRHSLASPSMFA